MMTVKLIKRLQKIFWIYWTNNFVITTLSGFKESEPEIKCNFVPITIDNYHRVIDFRETSRMSEYRDKFSRGEIGFFADHNGKMIGSIWATINKTGEPRIVRTYVKLIPNEGLIHDIVTADKFRGLGVGPFMVTRIAPILLEEYGLSRIIVDVNVRNRSSLRMMEKAGLRMDHQMLSVSAFGTIALQLVMRRYV